MKATTNRFVRWSPSTTITNTTLALKPLTTPNNTRRQPHFCGYHETLYKRTLRRAPFGETGRRCAQLVQEGNQSISKETPVGLWQKCSQYETLPWWFGRWFFTSSRRPVLVPRVACFFAGIGRIGRGRAWHCPIAKRLCLTTTRLREAQLSSHKLVTAMIPTWARLVASDCHISYSLTHLLKFILSV